MKTRALVIVALMLLAGARVAHADAGMAGMVMSGTGTAGSDGAPASAVTGSVSLLAAQFDTMYYVGSYQGIVPAASWSRGALGVSASLPIYHLDENGLGLYGIGDAMLHAHGDLAAVPWGRAGVAAMVMLPTGNGENGLGMGHLMVQPAVWTTAQLGAVQLTAAGGYNRALAQLADHVHGIWPLVEPMNMSELTWSGAADVAVWQRVRVGGRVFGGLPIGAPGIARVIAAGRVSWGHARVTTGVEVQAGLAGDPFTVRGVFDTAVTF